MVYSHRLGALDVRRNHQNLTDSNIIQHLTHLTTTIREDELTSPKSTTGSTSRRPITSEVFDSYWRFASERQNVYLRRWLGEPEQWTDNQVLQRHKFTNAYRAADRVSQYLIKNVIYKDSEASNSVRETTRDPDEIFFRVLIFKFFNRISTWQELEYQLGEVSFATYDFDRYDKVLTSMKDQGQRIFSSAYIMPSGTTSFGYPQKHRNLLRLLEVLIEDNVPWRLTELRTMEEAFKLLRSYPMLGDFLAYQFVIDLNYSPLTNFSEMEFVVAGPGARDGIEKCFMDKGGLSEADLIKWTTERQQEEFNRLGLTFLNLWGRPLQLIDCQNLFCEVDKYARVVHPEVKGLSGRSRIKQLFGASSDPLVPWFPPKWGINAALARDSAKSQEIVRALSCQKLASQIPTLPF